MNSEKFVTGAEGIIKACFKVISRNCASNIPQESITEYLRLLKLMTLILSNVIHDSTKIDLVIRILTEFTILEYIDAIFDLLVESELNMVTVLALENIALIYKYLLKTLMLNDMIGKKKYIQYYFYSKTQRLSQLMHLMKRFINLNDYHMYSQLIENIIQFLDQISRSSNMEIPDYSLSINHLIDEKLIQTTTQLEFNLKNAGQFKLAKHLKDSTTEICQLLEED